MVGTDGGGMAISALLGRCAPHGSMANAVPGAEARHVARPSSGAAAGARTAVTRHRVEAADRRDNSHGGRARMASAPPASAAN